MGLQGTKVFWSWSVGNYALEKKTHTWVKKGRKRMKWLKGTTSAHKWRKGKAIKWGKVPTKRQAEKLLFTCWLLMRICSPLTSCTHSECRWMFFLHATCSATRSTACPLHCFICFHLVYFCSWYDCFRLVHLTHFVRSVWHHNLL